MQTSTVRIYFARAFDTIMVSMVQNSKHVKQPHRVFMVRNLKDSTQLHGATHIADYETYVGIADTAHC